MASSFVQILACMDVPVGDVVKSAAENALDGGSSNSAGTGKGGKAAAANTAAAMGLRDAASERSVMDLMGSITKKLVITPAGDIGVRRQRSYSVTGASAAGQVPRGAGEYMQSMQAKTYEEEEIVMMEG